MGTQFAEAGLTRIMRRKEVEAVTGLARSTIYERMKNGDFPKPISLGGRCVGWLEDEISAWLEARVAASRASSRDPENVAYKKLSSDTEVLQRKWPHVDRKEGSSDAV